MLVSEFVGLAIEDILNESDEYMLKSILDVIILDIKDGLSKNRNISYTLDQVINELNKRTTSVYIDKTDDDIRNNIIQSFENHGLSVDRGSGNIELEASAPEAGQVDDRKQERERQSQKVNSKAMDKIKKGESSDRNGEL